MPIKYCPSCKCIMKYQVQGFIYQCVKDNCGETISIDEVGEKYLCIFSKTFETQFSQFSIDKYMDDDFVYQDKNNICPKCGTPYKFLATGGNSSVETICMCQKKTVSQIE